MNYLAIHRDSLNALFAKDFQKVKTRLKKEVSDRDPIWIHPLACWVPYYRTEETSGIVLPVVKKKDKTETATVITSFLEVSEQFHQVGNRLDLDEDMYWVITHYNLQIAYLRMMERWGKDFFIFANYVESIYHTKANACLGRVPFLKREFSLVKEKEPLNYYHWLVEDEKNPKKITLYFFYFTDWTQTVSRWIRTEDTTWYNRRMLLLPKDTYDNYYVSRMPRIHEQNFPDALTKCLHTPGMIELLEAIHTCADDHDILLHK